MSHLVLLNINLFFLPSSQQSKIVLIFKGVINMQLLQSPAFRKQILFDTFKQSYDPFLVFDFNCFSLNLLDICQSFLNFTGVISMNLVLYMLVEFV